MCLNIKIEDFRKDPNKYDISWQCNACLNITSRQSTGNDDVPAGSMYKTAPNVIDADTSIDSLRDFVTKRKNYVINISTENSFASLSTEDDEEERQSSLLCNEVYQNCNETEELRVKIQQLQNKLADAENKITMILSENLELKQKNSKLELNAKLNTITYGSPTSTKNIDKELTSNKKKKINKNKRRLNFTNIEEQTNTSLNIDNDKSHDNEPHTNKNSQQSSSSDLFISKKNLCIISSGNQHSLINLLENTNVATSYNYCHYILNGAGIDDMLKSASTKVKNFNKNDYCVILVGEHDFTAGQDVNYFDLVLNINYHLETLKHTNILFALPTYICGAIIHNYNIEVFNKLMLRDYGIFKNACCFDSNLHLQLNMFSSKTGKLNKSGLKNIIEHITNYIQEQNYTSIDYSRSSTLCTSGKNSNLSEPSRRTTASFFLQNSSPLFFR